MYYEPGSQPHGLPHDPLKSCVVPRPIGWISTISAEGVANLAPYSFFNLVATEPPLVMYSSCGTTPWGAKDSSRNIETQGQFVVNMATYAQRDAVVASSAPLPPEIDEFEHAGLGKLPSRRVSPPRVSGAPVHLECERHRIVELPHEGEGRNVLVIGRVVGVHIADAALNEGMLDVARIQPLARLGYKHYARVAEVFTLSSRTAPQQP